MSEERIELKEQEVETVEAGVTKATVVKKESKFKKAVSWTKDKVKKIPAKKVAVAAATIAVVGLAYKLTKDTEDELESFDSTDYEPNRLCALTDCSEEKSDETEVENSNELNEQKL